ncbi:MAG: VanW family protein [Chloroflexota bacterium]|nr:VanW family protein [Chloroflexota bacterium]
MKQQHAAILAALPRPRFRGRAVPLRNDTGITASKAAVRPGPSPRAWAPRLAYRAAIGLAVLVMVAVVALLLLRTAHDGRVYPAIIVANLPVGGLTRADASQALAQRAAAIEQMPAIFRYGDREWRASLAEIGITADADTALTRAFQLGREQTAWQRLWTTASLIRDDQRIAMPLAIDHARLGQWFDQMDGDLAMGPRDAALEITGTGVTIVPEVDGTVVNREQATAALVDSLRLLQPLAAELPITARAPIVRVADLEPARAALAQALTAPVQVSFESGIWTLPARELAGFVTQSIDPALRGAPAFSVGLDQGKLATWLADRLAPEINREPRNAEVGWNGERVVSMEWSVDGVELDPVALAGQVQRSFLSDHAAVAAPVDVTRPTIDSNNLAALGIVTQIAKGTSNYSGSIDGRANNIMVGARLLNGTLIAPHAEFSFNHSIGYITEELGYVEAQVIQGETIGQDIGGGICQVSTTVFRAAYLAGMPITEWWPHTFRIPFYEYDGWPPGLDASILQPTEDPSSWGDFRFENPTDSWLLIESWTDGVNVVVVIYGADLGWQVDTNGPVTGDRFQVRRDQEIVDPELDPGTIQQTSIPVIGEEFGHFRAVYDRNGDLLWERNFYTKFSPQGNIWKVSPDMRGKSPSDPNRTLPPLPPPANASG